MENIEMYDLPSWVLETEEDFCFGAKATPFLPSATEKDVASKNVSFELPEWMESRNILGSGKFFNDADFLQTIKYDNEVEDKYISSIKPEDMLVPLSELQPQTIPKDMPANPVIKAPQPIPKIILCRKVVTKIPQPKIQIQPHAVPDLQYQSTPNIHFAQQREIPASIEASTSKCDADDLINEMVQMIGNDSADDGFANVNNSLFNSPMIEANMDDLLSQLESSSSQSGVPELSHSQLSEVSSWSSESASPVSLPSPVPSAGSLSPPQATYDSLFTTLLSPYEDRCRVASSPSISENYEEDLGELEAHSYSRSPLKKKASRKSSSRKSPYPENRKERKKEQNKQAALRYRQKKKQEDDDIMGRIHAEEERQEQLKTKYTNLKQELGYLKKIMREVFIAKGILSADAFKKK